MFLSTFIFYQGHCCPSHRSPETRGSHPAPWTVELHIIQSFRFHRCCRAFKIFEMAAWHFLMFWIRQEGRRSWKRASALESPGVSIIYQRALPLCILHIVLADSPSSATGAVGYFVNFRTSVIDNMSEGDLLWKVWITLVDLNRVGEEMKLVS